MVAVYSFWKGFNFCKLAVLWTFPRTVLATWGYSMPECRNLWLIKILCDSVIRVKERNIILLSLRHVRCLPVTTPWLLTCILPSAILSWLKRTWAKVAKWNSPHLKEKKKPLCLSPYIATLQSYSQVTVQILRRCGVSRTLLASV